MIGGVSTVSPPIMSFNACLSQCEKNSFKVTRFHWWWTVWVTGRLNRGYSSNYCGCSWRDSSQPFNTQKMRKRRGQVPRPCAAFPAKTHPRLSCDDGQMQVVFGRISQVVFIFWSFKDLYECPWTWYVNTKTDKEYINRMTCQRLLSLFLVKSKIYSR